MTPTKAFCYYRASTAKQDTSVDQQRKELRKFAKKQNILIVEEFVDDGISAFKKDVVRSGFESLLKACKGGNAQYVLVWNINRFSRQSNAGVIDLFTLEQHGVKVMDSEGTVYDSTDLGGAINGLLGLFGAEKYSKNLSRDVARGFAKRKEDGYAHGMCSFGYQLTADPNNSKKNVWIPDPDKSPVVIEIFECFDKGMTFQAITKWLNDQGIKPLRAKAWSAISIAQILRNPCYGGYQGSVERKNYTLDGLTKRKITTFIDPELWKRCFNAAQANRRKGDNGLPRRKNPLTGLVFCPVCGESAHVISGNQNIPKYRCRGVRYTTCVHRANVNREHLEWAIVDQARDCVMEEGHDNLIKRLIDEQLAKDKQLLEDVQPLYDRLDELTKAEDQLLDLMLNQGDSPALSSKRQKLLEERISVEEQIEDNDTGVTPMSYNEAHSTLTIQLFNLNNLNNVVDHIDRIEIIAKDCVKVIMFGWEIDLDLSDWTDERSMMVKTTIFATQLPYKPTS